MSFSIGNHVSGGINPRFQNIGYVTYINEQRRILRYRNSSGRLTQVSFNKVVKAPSTPNKSERRTVKRQRTPTKSPIKKKIKVNSRRNTQK